MHFRGDPTALASGPLRRLNEADLPDMMALAAAGDAMVFSPQSLKRGEFFGIFVGPELAAMGGVQTYLPGHAEIGSIVTHPQYRRQGYATQVVHALIRHLHVQDCQTFLCLFQTNRSARSLYEKLGFEVINELYLMHWRLK
ncbi:MAG: GNAT family N-acetyltransferase [Caldilineales bacterium]|nr:GNAT family N-acetyltransferase [Caldilineales bacterium]